jgi:hypothetical protein
VLSGVRGYIDFGEQFPYDPEQAQGLFIETGFDLRNPLSYSMMTNGAEGALPTIATFIKMPHAKLRVEVTVGIINRMIFLQQLTKDRDWEQAVNLTGAAAGPYSRTRDTWTGNDTPTDDDKHVDILVDRVKESGTDRSDRP